MDFKVSRKIDDKWKTLGNIKTNKFGNPSLGLHCTAEFKKIIADAEDGSWINLSLFENDKK